MLTCHLSSGNEHLLYTMMAYFALYIMASIFQKTNRYNHGTLTFLTGIKNTFLNYYTISYFIKKAFSLFIQEGQIRKKI